ncbi:MAG: S8 family serine peptidase, partial [Stackebrandtia sp.]
MASDPRTALLRGLTVILLAGVGVAAPDTAHADSIRDQQWHLGSLNIAEAHEITRGKGVTVAVLDSGVDHRHPDLRGAVIKGHTYAGGRADGWGDSDGHGTAMAGLIAGHGHGSGHGAGALGIAPEANILPVRVGNGRSNGRAVEQGIEWAADHGADVINISTGGASEGYYQDAVDHALEQGIVVVASAGNTADGSTDVGWPAAAQGVVAVSGTDQDGAFSDESVSGPETALSAPAEEIMSAGSDDRGQYATGTGTSDSAAIVSGVAALIRAKYPDLDATNVINRLIATADDKGPE